jgi:hypothetical protein
MVSKYRVRFPFRSSKKKAKKAAQQIGEELRTSSRISARSHDEAISEQKQSLESQHHDTQGNSTPSLPFPSSSRPVSEPLPRTAYREDNDDYDYSPTASLMAEEPLNSFADTQHASPSNDQSSASSTTIRPTPAALVPRPLLPHTQQVIRRPLPTNSEGNVLTYADVEARLQVDLVPRNNPLAGYSCVEPDVFVPAVVQRGGFYQPEGGRREQELVIDRPGDPWQLFLNKEASRSSSRSRGK